MTDDQWREVCEAVASRDWDKVDEALAVIAARSAKRGHYSSGYDDTKATILQQARSRNKLGVYSF